MAEKYYLDKDDVLNKLHIAYELARIDQKAAVSTAIADINAIPASDVQPVKRGHWIEQRHTPTNGYNYNVPYSTYVCSICGLKIHNDEYSKYVRGTYTNCPVCTAIMDLKDGDIND